MFVVRCSRLYTPQLTYIRYPGQVLRNDEIADFSESRQRLPIRGDNSPSRYQFMIGVKGISQQLIAIAKRSGVFRRDILFGSLPQPESTSTTTRFTSTEAQGLTDRRTESPEIWL
jgi:hypothetical protein